VLCQVTLPVAEIVGMKPTHVHVLIGLLSFADRAGKCWPSLRRLADTVGMSLTRVQRAIAEMEVAGHLTRRRRFGSSTVYRVARRFLPVFQNRNTDSADPQPRPRICPQPTSPACGTEGVARTDRQIESKEGELSMRHFAPLLPGPNPHARKRWLDKLHGFVCQYVRGTAQWEAWTLIDKARVGLIDRAEQRMLDKLDLAMRAMGYRLPHF
jgi:hypothetical protein